MQVEPGFIFNFLSIDDHAALGVRIRDEPAVLAPEKHRVAARYSAIINHDIAIFPAANAIFPIKNWKFLFRAFVLQDNQCSFTSAMASH